MGREGTNGWGWLSMPECIVCKGYYEAGQHCTRCDSDNVRWDEWRATHTEEQGGMHGLLAFYSPCLYIPFFITMFAIPFGLMGIGRLWRGITPAAQLLAFAVTICLCSLATLAAYSARHSIREQGLLNRVRQGYGKLLGSARFKVIIVPVLSVLVVLLITYVMITSNDVWKLTQWLFLDPAYLTEVTQQEVEQQETAASEIPEEDQPKEAVDLGMRIRQVLPFTFMGTYIAVMTSLTYAISLQRALAYAQEMNGSLPQPVFLQDSLLTRLVRTQAEGQLNRQAGFVMQTTRTLDAGSGAAEGTIASMFNRLLPPPRPAEHGEQQTAHLHRQLEQTLQSGNWNWEELERTEEGGIIMKASGRQYIQAPGTPDGLDKQEALYVFYTVVADPWGRIIKITRTAEEASK